MEKEVIPYIHRDISWLSFNYRVLQEAKDPNTPLFERIKFLAIYSSNLDEFFRVRVANHRNLVRLGKKAKRKLDFEPELILKQVLKIVSEQQEEFSDIFENEIIPDLNKHRINLIKRKSFSKEQIEFIEDYFSQNLLPFVQPVLLIEDKIKPFLSNGSLYLALHMKSKHKKSEDKDHDRKKDEDSVYAITKMPSDQLNRFIELPPREEGSRDLVMLDDVVRHIVRFIYPGYDILDTFSIKLTRDAELYIDDEFSGDLIGKIKKSLKKRNVGPASRMVYDREIPKHFLHYLSTVFDITNFDLLPEGRYHNNSDFFKFPKVDDPELYDQQLSPTPFPQLEDADSILDKIREQDHIIHVPYQSYESVIKFFEDAAVDPEVTHIKIVQYRVSKKSRIMNALMQAAKAGKKVNAFVEVKARFDEELNIEWGEKLEQAGVNVNYSMPGLKVHSKMAMVIRKEGGAEEKYCYFSSGNFHEGTVNLYSDIGVFTHNKDISEEAYTVFNYLEKKEPPSKPFQHLGVGQFGLKEKIIGLIKKEIKNAENGLEAGMTLKMNSLQDPGMIELLYKASRKGVKIKLIVRGMCSLVAGVQGVSENIKAISIVDRYLEHARIFIFHNNGEEKIYLSSADLMFRNLHHRVETMIPIYAGHIRKIIKDMMDIQWSDNTKARFLTNKKLNEYRKIKDDTKIIRSQEVLHEYFKERTASL